MGGFTRNSHAEDRLLVVGFLISGFSMIPKHNITTAVIRIIRMLNTINNNDSDTDSNDK